MTLNSLFAFWLADLEDGGKPSTRRTYRCHGRALCELLGEMEVSEIGPLEARKVKGVMVENDATPATIRQRLGVLKALLQYGRLLGEKIQSTDWRLPIPAERTQDVETLSAAEHGRLFKAILEDLASGRLQMLPALISMSTGMRIGEVCGLRWEDVDLKGKNPIITVRRQAHTIYTDGKKIVVGEPKSKSAYRVLPLPIQLKEVLKACRPRKAKGGECVIGGKMEPISERTVRANFTRFIYSLPVKKVKFHALRHTYATMLVATGRDVKAISKMMGHASVATTLDLYVHPSAEYKRITMRKAFKTLSSLHFDSKTFHAHKSPH